MTKLLPLGDQAALAYFADEAAALRFAATVHADNAAWLIDVVQGSILGRLHHIPCCYEMQLDLDRVSAHTGLATDDIIRLHTATEYTVYAIGFCPGFPYLGYLPAQLCGVPRLDQPRLRVAAGSVGLTGRQTGIYAEERPGGWNILGRTPLELVNVADGYFPLRVGDRVKFERIDESAYRNLEGERL